MESNSVAGTVRANGSVVVSRQVGCPMCGGMLVPMRDQYRCSRCFFSLCVGCEPEDVPGQGGVEDGLAP
jgi:hypothetical protein